MMTEHQPSLLSWFDDHISFSEAHLTETLLQVADAGACEILLRSLIVPPSSISRPVLELLLACKTISSHFYCINSFFRSLRM